MRMLPDRSVGVKRNPGVSSHMVSASECPLRRRDLQPLCRRGRVGERGRVAPEEPTQRASTLEVENLLFKDSRSQTVRRWTVSAYRTDLHDCVDAYSMNVGTTTQPTTLSDRCVVGRSFRSSQSVGKPRTRRREAVVNVRPNGSARCP